MGLLLKGTPQRVGKEVRGFGTQVHPGDPITPGFNANKLRGGFAWIWLGLLEWVWEFDSSAVSWQEILLSCSHLVLPPSSLVYIISILHYMD